MHSMHCHGNTFTLAVSSTENFRQDGWPGTARERERERERDYILRYSSVRDCTVVVSVRHSGSNLSTRWFYWFEYQRRTERSERIESGIEVREDRERYRGERSTVCRREQKRAREIERETA